MAIILLIIFLFTAIFCKLIYLQVVSSEKLQVKAIDQWTRDVPITGERGDIFDVNGNLLADTATTYTLYARPNSIADKAYVAQVLGAVLQTDVDTLYNKINTRVSEVTIAKKVSSEEITEIFRRNVSGIYYAQNIDRKYIYGDFLSMVLGFVNIDGVGQTGIEAKYNEYLQGTNGMILTETDLVGRELSSNVTEYIQGAKGANVYLTIDYAIQNIVQNAVNDAYTTHNAKAVSCIMMNPKTGAVLAMAQAPSFDLNQVPRDDLAKLMSLSRNTIVTNVYEPGSTFKVLTAALGLENGYIELDKTHCFCPGYRIVDGKRIKCWRTIGHGVQTFPEAVQNSCNCMFMDIATGIGKENMYQGLQKFGITQKTGIDVSGEAGGLMIDYETVKNVDLARIGFGQAVAVTAMELIVACSSVINGGELLIPYLVDRIEQNGKTIIKNEKKVKNKVIGTETSLIMRSILEGVVTNGGGKNAQVPGYRIGGKTGTAQKYGADGRIASGKYVATFMGFAPADDPEYILLFIVDEPSTGAYYGSVVSAPYASQIYSQVFAYKGIKAQNIVEKEKIIMPGLIGVDRNDACKILSENNLYFEYYEENETGRTVTYQIPAPGSEITTDTLVYISLS